MRSPRLHDYEWKYTGPIFDAHTHIIRTGYIDENLRDEEEFGVKAQVVISHSQKARDEAHKRYPGRFVFAKYLSISDVLAFKTKNVVQAIEQMHDQGYSMAKMWVAPRSRDFAEHPSKAFNLKSPKLEPIFDKLVEKGYPLILHVADPDTFFQTFYADSKKYGTKEHHLADLEYLIQKNPDLQFQLAHFASQPEVHRFSNLAEWFEKYPNISVDTASSRWMTRELSKDPEKSRKFLIKYSKRILFGTDANVSATSTSTRDKDPSQALRSHYTVRILAQRILWETKKRHVPLPFPDPDTTNTGGTFINGLNLPERVLKDIYWDNAQRLYGALIQ